MWNLYRWTHLTHFMRWFCWGQLLRLDGSCSRSSSRASEARLHRGSPSSWAHYWGHWLQISRVDLQQKVGRQMLTKDTHKEPVWSCWNWYYLFLISSDLLKITWRLMTLNTRLVFPREVAWHHVLIILKIHYAHTHTPARLRTHTYICTHTHTQSMWQCVKNITLLYL